MDIYKTERPPKRGAPGGLKLTKSNYTIGNYCISYKTIEGPICPDFFLFYKL